jgi:cobalt transporter subunit CbtA
MSDLDVLKRIVAAAALAGLLTGLLLTAVQQVRVVPVLLEAEVYEQAAGAPSPSGNSGSHAGHEHASEHAAHGLQRTVLSAAANVVLAIGYALLLVAAMFASRVPPGWRAGLAWGLAGYAVFFLAPALGLPPELPGTEAARLTDRQLWWLMTVLCTAAGLSLVVFGRGWRSRIPGVLLLLAPHLVGAPQPHIHGTTAPAALTDAFIFAAVLTNLVFWLALGGLLGYFHGKLLPIERPSPAVTSWARTQPSDQAKRSAP